MAGVCIYCGAAALITGPSGVCPQCRATLPVKKVKPGKFTGKGVKAPTFLMGAGATGVVETKKAAVVAVATATAEPPAMALSPAALRPRVEADLLAAYGAPTSPPATQETAPPDQAATPTPPDAPPQPQEPAAAQETPAPEEAAPVPPPTPAQTYASVPQTAAPVQEPLASYPSTKHFSELLYELEEAEKGYTHIR